MYLTAPQMYYYDPTLTAGPPDKKNKMGLFVKLSQFEKPQIVNSNIISPSIPRIDLKELVAFVSKLSFVQRSCSKREKRKYGE
ncbi:hypothetical protein Tco_0421536 [Tanacetum coccineum]